MKPRYRILMIAVLGLALASCKKNPSAPLAPGMFVFEQSGTGEIDTLYGSLDTTSTNLVFKATGVPQSWGFDDLDLQITVYYSSRVSPSILHGTYWDTATVTTAYGPGFQAIHCQLWAPTDPTNFNWMDIGMVIPFRLHIVSNTGNNIQGTFAGTLNMNQEIDMDILNGRFNVNY